MREGAETCDDGGTAPGNGCSATCQIEAGYSCTGAPSVCALACPSGQLYRFDSASLSLPIPDNNAAGVSHVFTVPGSVTGTITKVSVRVEITHEFVGDLDLRLASPLGPPVALSLGNGGAGDNYFDTVFDSTCATAITSGTPPFTGCYRPEQALTAYDGQAPSGAWTFTVSDGSAQDFGSFNNWSLMICVLP